MAGLILPSFGAVGLKYLLAKAYSKFFFQIPLTLAYKPRLIPKIPPKEHALNGVPSMHFVNIKKIIKKIFKFFLFLFLIFMNLI